MPSYLFSRPHYVSMQAGCFYLFYIRSNLLLQATSGERWRCHPYSPLKANNPRADKTVIAIAFPFLSLPFSCPETVPLGPFAACNASTTKVTTLSPTTIISIPIVLA